nr:hypothetical protein [Tanacetum cinerariifolium]
MANTTPLVTTVTKPTNNPGEANTAPRVNIQELYEEYYEDILPIIMEEVRHERRKDVHARLDFGEERVMANTTPLVTTVTKPANNPGEANTARRVNIQELCEEYYENIIPIIMEKARHDRLKDVHARLDFGEGVEKASAALENHTMILPPTPIVTKAVVTIQREETGLRHLASREAIQATKRT